MARFFSTAAAAITLLCSQPTSAETFNFSFSGTYVTVSSVIDATDLYTTYNGYHEWLATSMTGTVDTISNGMIEAITGLVPGGPDVFYPPDSGGLSADNVILYPSAKGYAFADAIAFTTASSILNIYTFGPGSSVYPLWYFTNSGRILDYGAGSLTLVGDATPEVSTWAMILAGFAGLSLCGYRRGGHLRRSDARRP